MARKLEYKKAFPDLVMDMALARHRLTNSMVAKRLDVSESTVRNWRKDHPDFNRAFTDAREMLREKITNTARKSLDVRKRKTVLKGPKGETTQVEDVLPTHSDIAVFSKYLGLGSAIHSETDKRRETLRTVMKDKVAGNRRR
ncbi:hypothetical protein WAA39_002323 [Enterobacter mori]|jgi:transposase-like protein|uniref:helix-turn-helix domain-containing protein n=1 Tax=Enterobacter mori TaxID=539813 RepID=UPI0025C7C9F1|nr:hypothetical protein [Enterobacter mori]EME8859685.1 hypothetical protein [Enterobacter mori]